jgi:poly(A) polymerase
LPGFEEFKVWNPKVNPRDKLDLMPILTPTFPAMNTTYNCSEMNKSIILNEMKRAYAVVVNVLSGKGNWSEVYQVEEPWAVCSDFLVLQVSARREGYDRDAVHKWQGFVESKMRIFYKNLEEYDGLVIRPYPDPIIDETVAPTTWSYLIGMEFSRENGAENGAMIDFRPALVSMMEVLSGWTEPYAVEGKVVLSAKFMKAEEIPTHWRSAKPDSKGTFHILPEKKKTVKREKAELEGSSAKRRA